MGPGEQTSVCGPTTSQVVTVYATTYGEVKAKPHPFLTSAPDQLQAPTALLPGKSRRYPFYKWLGGQPSYYTNTRAAPARVVLEGRLAQIDILENDSKHKQM